MKDKRTKKIKKIICAALNKWLRPLGLLWWKIDIFYSDNPTDVLREFGSDDDGIVLARTFADWRYGTASIHFNVLDINEARLDSKEIEQVVLHELCHILVCEMCEGEKHHEERVVTCLTSAFTWVSEGV